VLHPVPGSNGYRYTVTLDGEEIVTLGRDPEHEAARACLARGITGRLELVDANTGMVRTRFDIERAAKLTVVERDAGGLRFEKYRPFSAVGPQTAEKASGGPYLPDDTRGPSTTPSPTIGVAA
jgi:hypothetical protein